MKNEKLLSQQTRLKQKETALSEAYKDAIKMMKDVSMDPIKRKQNILSATKQILSDGDAAELSACTNEKTNVHLDVNALNQMLSTIGSVADGFGALPPTLRVTDIGQNSAKIIIEANEEEKECIGHQLQYAQNTEIGDSEEKVNWNAVSLQGNATQHSLRSLTSSTTYVLRARSQNKSGWGAYSKRTQFKTNDIDPIALVKPQMVFDSYKVDASVIQIVNSQYVKCIKEVGYDKSVRMKCGMPTRGNNEHNLKSISWKLACKFTEGCYPFFVGVTSNRATEMKSACDGLTDAFGINDNAEYVYKGNPENKTACACVSGASSKGFKSGSSIRMEYEINASTLKFYQSKTAQESEIYSIALPQKAEITHWFPCVSLYKVNDECRLHDVVVNV